MDKIAWLYNWPDGWKLGRRLDSRDNHADSTAIFDLVNASGDLELVLRLSHLGMDDPDSDKYVAPWLRLFVQSQPGQTFYYKERPTVKQADLWRPRLLAFVLDMLVPPGFDPFYGPVTSNMPHWFGVPLFVEDAVWTRMDDPTAEAKIQELWKKHWEIYSRLLKERCPNPGSQSKHDQYVVEQAQHDSEEQVREAWMAFVMQAFGGLFTTNDHIIEEQRLEQGLPGFVSVAYDDAPLGWQLDGGIEPYTRFYLLISMKRSSKKSLLWDIRRVFLGDYSWVFQGSVAGGTNKLISLWRELTWMTYQERQQHWMVGRAGGGSPISPDTKGWSVRWKSTEDAWWDANMLQGEAVYDDRIFLALNATPPHLLPQSQFEIWWTHHLEQS